MNNKFQKALDLLYKNIKVYTCLELSKQDKENLAILQELVDKATPKKPIGKHTNYKCPICSRRVRSGKGSSSHQRDNVCQRCYQVLDWSDNND